jgi:RNA polymerase sigma-70 factor (ECF subfamily)
LAEDEKKQLERRLVKKILKGDEEAFLVLYNNHKHRLARTAAHFLGYTDPSIEDVVQDTFATAYPKLKEFRFESSLYTWLNRFTVNFCFQTINKRKKTVLSETEKLEGYAARITPNAPDLLKKALLQDIETLDEDHREVVRLKDLEGHTYLQIADELGLAPGTVMSRLSRARAKLKERIGERKEVYDDFFKDK